MKNSKINLRKALINMGILAFILSLIAIAIIATYPYIIGPNISNYEYTELSDMYYLHGTSTRTKILKVQGREVPISATGAWSTQIVKLKPYTILIIEARDRFDHSLLIKKEL